MRNRTALTVMLVAVVTALGCGGSMEKQVLIASDPAGAVVKIDGVEMGRTPVSLTFAEETTLTVEQSGYESQEVRVDAETGPNLIVALVRIEVPVSAQKGYSTMRQIKTAYRNGDISRESYDQYKAKIRANRAVELERAKRDLREGRLTEGKYKQRVRAIKEKFEG